jgi:hypothetical protein
MTSASTGSTTSCEHCDGSLAHEHVDIAEVRSRVRSLTRWVVVRGLLVLAGAGIGVAALATSTTAQAMAGPVAALVLAGVAAWLVVTVLTVAVAGLALQRRARTEPAPDIALAIGSVAGAAGTPVAALAVALLSGAPWWTATLAAGLGWAGAAILADLVGGLRLRAGLLAGGRTAESRRLAGRGMAGSADPGQLVATMLGAAVFAGWVAALDVLPVLVVVLVPLHAGLAARAGAARTRPAPRVAASS